jgi:hypothetical protein
MGATMNNWFVILLRGNLEPLKYGPESLARAVRRAEALGDLHGNCDVTSAGEPICTITVDAAAYYDPKR